ncbi:MAG: hypothetical protein Q4D29_12560 [Lachnospiraceae bacterium]|nr:hypothetical protein [Lachnospiraceae bacterium]
MFKSLDKKRIAALAIFLIGILAVAYYILVAQRVEFDSDYTDTLLWAEAMISGHGLFNKAMYYAYTLPFGGSLLMVPFVAIFGISYKAQVLGILVLFVIFVIALYMMFKAMDFSVNESLVAVGTIMLFTLPSKEIRMTMWGHVIHYSLGLLFVALALWMFSKINISDICINIGGKGGKKITFGNKQNVIWIVVLAVFSLLCCSNGLTTILFFVIPFFGAVIIERFIDTDNELFSKENISTLAVVIISFIAGGAGFVASKILQRGVVTVYDSMFKDIPMWQHWVWDINERVRIFLMCSTGIVENKVAMESFSGIRIMYMALFSFILIFVPFIATISYKKFENRIMKIFLISYYILLFATLFVFDFSMARGTSHRLTGVYMTAISATVMYMIWLARDIKLQRFGYVLGIVFVMAGLFCLYGVASLRGQNRYDGLIKVLKDNNLKYGYAEYWSAQVTTVLSDNNVEVCPIIISEDGELSKNLYNIYEEQYATKDGVDRYFAFLSAWEYETVKDTLASDAIDVIQYDSDGYIVVFDHNIF